MTTEQISSTEKKNTDIRLENVSYIYSPDTPFRKVALDDVSLTIHGGVITGLMGHTGSGKSTLVQLLNGLNKPTSGKVFVGGDEIWADPKKVSSFAFRVGLVFQYPEYQLFEETVYKDIAFGPKNMGLPPEEIQRRVREAAAFVGVPEEHLEKSPFDLSGGQKRRVAIAGVIAMEPDVLILDEPTAGLDPQGRDSILENIRAYQKAKNATVMMVSHAMEEVARVTDRLLVMDHGGLRMDNSPREVFRHAWELQQIGLAIPQVTRVFLRLRELGVPVDSSVYTVEQAARELLRLKGGKGSC